MQTTVVGNYPKIPNRPRPARLRNAINKRDRGELSNEELERCEQRSRSRSFRNRSTPGST
jgi:methionine synthase II (cobalamin-independent)